LLKTAVIEGDYRYQLTRTWDTALPTLFIVMCNPSTADADRDDPTVRKCIEIAKTWRYGSIDVRNLFAFRSPTPATLRNVINPIGPKNDAYLREVLPRFLAAWGKNGSYMGRDESAPLPRVRLTLAMIPIHPLALSYIAKPVPKEPVSWS
jgi:hypothetical protein